MSEEPEKLTEGTLLSHLLELRTRLVRAIVAVFVLFMPCAYYANTAVRDAGAAAAGELPKGGTLIATGVMSPFTTPFKLSFMVALIRGMPYVLCQLWGFVAPGLYRNEKRFAVPLLVSSICCSTWASPSPTFFVFPLIFKFFSATTPAGVQMMTDINSYLDFVLTMFLAFGVAFEVPIAVVLLAHHRPCQYQEAHRNARLRGYRHLRGRRDPDAAGRAVHVHDGGADVAALSRAASSLRAS